MTDRMAISDAVREQALASPAQPRSPQPRSPQPRPAASSRFLVVFAGLAAFMGTGVGLAQITTSLYAVKLGASGTMLALIAGAQSVGVLIMSLPVGVLVDRFEIVRSEDAMHLHRGADDRVGLRIA